MKAITSHILLAVYLVLVGLIDIFHIDLGSAGIIVPVLALVAGIMMLLGK